MPLSQKLNTLLQLTNLAFQITILRSLILNLLHNLANLTRFTLYELLLSQFRLYQFLNQLNFFLNQRVKGNLLLQNFLKIVLFNALVDHHFRLQLVFSEFKVAGLVL